MMHFDLIGVLIFNVVMREINHFDGVTEHSSHIMVLVSFDLIWADFRYPDTCRTGGRIL